MIATEQYKAKEFNLSGLNGISDRTLEMHFKLYEGYVTETNKLSEKISEFLRDGKVDQEEMPVYSELKRRLGFEFNGMILHEYYFENLRSGGGGDPVRTSSFYEAAEASFGSYATWKADFVGKPELAWRAEQEGYPRLVGLLPVDAGIVPPEASQIITEAINQISGLRGRLGAFEKNTLDTTGTMQSGYTNLLGYCSWGSNDPANAGVPYYGEIPTGSGVFWPGLFVNGAVTSDYVSTSARTYIDGNQNYGQSLEADLIRMGVTGTNGHVYEPYLDAVVFPQFLFPHYLQGLQAGLAYYHALPFLSWMNVVVCDPLMKSGVTAPMLPQFTDVTPTRIPSGSSAVHLTIHGDFFTTSEDTTVSLGGVACANIYVPNEIGCGCDTGTVPPGLLDLQMTSFMGTGIWPKAVVSYPALDVTGDIVLGGNVTISAYGNVGDTDLTFLSLGTASIPLNPYGVLGLDLTNHFMLLFSATLPAEQYDIPGTLPSDPIYSGFSFYLQSLIGPDLATKNMKFTNTVGVTIP
jgi:hypothetical protein